MRTQAWKPHCARILVNAPNGNGKSVEIESKENGTIINNINGRDVTGNHNHKYNFKERILKKFGKSFDHKQTEEETETGCRSETSINSNDSGNGSETLSEKGIWKLSKIFYGPTYNDGDRNGDAVSIRRLFFFILLGACLSTLGMLLTEDEYYEGPRSNKAASCLQWEDSVISQQTHKVHIAFENLGCSIRTSSGSKTILSNVSGEIHPGRLTAILGQSGSGKTTFAYCLLGKGMRHCSPQHGTIYLNGYPRNLESFLDRVGFVPQDDVLHSELTVEEAISFSAKWRLPRSLSDEQRQEIIEETLRILDRGISGGERKRTSIGMELVARPSVLVMDEPTTSLDSSSAYRLVKMIRAVADSGVSVVAVLHQPSERIYELFHNLILLQNGEAAYVGPKEDVMDFLHFAGYGIPKNKSNSAEYLLDVLAELETPQNFNYAKNSSSAADVGVVMNVDTNNASCSQIKLPSLWRQFAEMRNSTFNFDDLEKEIILEDCFESLQQQPQSSRFQRIFSLLGINRICDAVKGSQYELFCSLFISDESVKGVPFYWVLPKPGLKRQLMMWFWHLLSLAWRRGVFGELAVVSIMATGVAYVRSFNNAWSRRANANFFLSLAVALLGMFGAIFTDEIAPTKRAAAAGMLLGAHEFAALLVVFIRGYAVAHIFSVVYFSVLWSRTGVWCTDSDEEASWMDFSAMSRLHNYYHFAHIVQLHYLASSAVGSVICVVTNHQQSMSYIAAAGALVVFHVFSCFSPNKNQIKRDSVFFSSWNLAPVVEFLCELSYVRYFMEAMLLWDPDTEDKNGRSFALRYYGFSSSNLSYCCNVLFLWSLVTQSIRFTIFSYLNSNGFHSLYDTPMFMIFLFKVLSCYILALIIMLLLQEWYFPWIEYVRARNRK